MASTWRQKGFDGGNTSYNPGAKGVPDGLMEKYSLAGHSTFDSRLHVLVTEDEYVLEGDDRILGYDRESGELNWVWHGEKDEGVKSVVDDEVIFTRKGFHAIERGRDRYEWHRSWGVTTEFRDAGLRLDDRSVFAGTSYGSDSDNGVIYELDMGSQNVKHLADTTYGVNNLLVTDTAVMCGTSVIAPSRIYTIDVIPRANENKSILLEKQTSSITKNTGFITPLLAGNDRVYIYRRNEEGDTFLEAHRYEKRTDSLDWSRELNLESVNSVLIRDILYVADSNRLLALNSHTGETLWSRTRKGSDDQPTNMVATLECLCVSGDEPVGLDPDTGEVLWRHGEPLTFKAVIDDEVVARNPEKNTVHVFRNDATKVYQG
jgi:outer membrane protein assembly factor BamB